MVFFACTVELSSHNRLNESLKHLQRYDKHFQQFKESIMVGR